MEELKLEKLQIKHNSPEWLEFRLKGLGGSDVASVLGLSPYKSNIDLFKEKTGKKEMRDISDVPCVLYGKLAEDLLVKLFELDYPEYSVKIDKNTVYKKEFMFASLDAEIEDCDGRKGILEIKTTEARNKQGLEKWNNQIPKYYYTQILHYLLVTDFDFAILKAQIKIKYSEETIIKHYKIEKKDLKEDLNYLYKKEKEFWQCVQSNKQPPMILPNF